MDKERFLGVPDDHIDEVLVLYTPIENFEILQEECAELIQAISKFKRNDQKRYSNFDSMKEEISHVLISLATVARLIEYTTDDLDKEIERKTRFEGRK